MDIVLPNPIRLKPTLGAGDSSYETWQPSTYYPGGFFVYDDANGRDYKALIGNIDQRPSQSDPLFWEDLGPSPGNVTGYVTNAPISEYRPWQSLDEADGEFEKAERCYLFASKREYEALRNVSAIVFAPGQDSECLEFFRLYPEFYADYTAVPKVCWRTDSATGFCVCFDPEMTQYLQHAGGGRQPTAPIWADLGAINPLRALDPKDTRRTIGPSPMTMTLQAEGVCDRIGFFGLQDVLSISVAGDVSIPTTSLQIGSSGIYRSSILLSHAPVTDPEYQLTLTAPGPAVIPNWGTNWLARKPQIGNIIAGRAFDCGPTEININNRIVTSRLTEDDYGNVSRPEQWYAKRLSGTVRPPARTADQVIALLSRDLDRPVVVDFSRGQLAESGPLVYGYVEQATHTITGLNDADAIEVIIRGFSQ